MVVQGNLLGLDWEHIYLYNNTLQAIAAGYLIAALLLLHCTVRMQVLGTAVLLLAYWLPMTFAGDFTPEGNFASRLDATILGRFRDDPTYTWIWSSRTDNEGREKRQTENCKTSFCHGTATDCGRLAVGLADTDH